MVKVDQGEREISWKPKSYLSLNRKADYLRYPIP